MFRPIFWVRLQDMVKLSPQIEDGLKKSMAFLGRIVEMVIGKAKEAKVQVGTRGGVQPILSVESLLDSGRVKELIESSTLRVMNSKMPDLSGLQTLEIGEGPASYGEKFLAYQAELAVSTEIGGGSVDRQGDISRGYVVRSSAGALPFENEKFSYILARLATPLQGDLVKGLREAGRVLKPGGQGVLVDYHPFGKYGKRGENKLRSSSQIHSLEDYYTFCRDVGLRVIDVKEVFVNENMRKMFRQNEIQSYRDLKGTPLTIFIFFYKPKRKG